MHNSIDNKMVVADYLYAREHRTCQPITDEQIREYIKLTTVEKLQWLEEANEIIQAASDEKNREIREKFRKGEI